MCIPSGPTPARQEAPAPPPPPPMEDPVSPAFNEDTTSSTNADLAVKGSRRGRKALRVDLNTSRAPGTASTGAAQGTPTGLNIPT